MTHNVLQLPEGGEFHHKTLFKAPIFKLSKNFHTKHLAAIFAKRLLPAGVSSNVVSA